MPTTDTQFLDIPISDNRIAFGLMATFLVASNHTEGASYQASVSAVSEVINAPYEIKVILAELPTGKAIALTVDEAKNHNLKEKDPIWYSKQSSHKSKKIQEAG